MNEAAETSTLTSAAARFVAGLRYEDLPAEVLVTARRCVLDGLAVQIGGTEQPPSNVLARHLRQFGGKGRSPLVGNPSRRLPAPQAALWNGICGHAMDWDDTQLAANPGRVYGLLTHPTIPPLAAAQAVSAHLGGVDGKLFLAAFVAGLEVECKIAEAINPDHYLRGFHTSGTIGVFGATATAAKLLDLDQKRVRIALGIAASMSAGIRANFGTMTKPLHVGRAAENGVTAALLAAEGFSADLDALDGKWGYLTISGPGGDPDLVVNDFGRVYSLVHPGVSVEPYPCGVLTHPSMDALLFLMRDEGLSAADIIRVDLYAGRNVLQPIRYSFAETELQGKFCFQFLLASIMIAGRAGKREFTDGFVRSPEVQAAQRKVFTHRDFAIEALGFDRIRSRIEVATRDGRRLARWADEKWGPEGNAVDSRWSKVLVGRLFNRGAWFQCYGDFFLQFGQIKALYNVEVGRDRLHVFFEGIVCC